MTDTCIDDGHLQHPGSQDRPGEVPGRRRRVGAAIERPEQRADHQDVEEDRGDGGGKEVMQGVEHARQHGGERHAHQIGEHDGGEPHRERELFRIVGETRGDHPTHQQRHGQFHGDGDQHQHREEDAEDLLGEALGALDAVRFDLLGKKRHEGGVESAFGEETAKEVRKTEGGVEDVGHRPRA